MKYKESHTVELKAEINTDFKKEIIAFANSDGGTIYIGIRDDGEIIGVENSTLVMERISNMIRDGIKPDLTNYTAIETINERNLEIVKLTVLRGTKRPYHLTDKGMKPSGVFIRHGVTSAPATDESIRHMIRESDGIVFDQTRSANQDLTFDYTKLFFKEGNVKFEKSHQRTLNLIDEDGYYTNAALLLSDQCTHSIKCAVYEGIGKTTFKTRKEFYGSILKQMTDAYDFINLNNNIHGDFNGLKRIDHLDYPEYAIREALINTIVHRDYDFSGSTLINIFSNRIEFVSLGGLVKGITLTDILRGISQTRNMRIANVFYRLKLIESYGTGMQRILESYESWHLQPTFLTAPASFVVILPNMNIPQEDVHDENLSPEENILNLLKQKGQITRKDVELLLSCSQFPAISALTNLLKEHKIQKIGSARSTKYILS